MLGRVAREVEFLASWTFLVVGELAERAQPVGPALGVPLVLVAVHWLTTNPRRPRGLAIGGLAALGALVAFVFRGLLDERLGVSTWVLGAGLGAAGAALGAAVPSAFPFLAAAAPGALAGQHLPLGSRGLGAAAGAVCAGLVALLLARPVAAVAGGLGGGLLLALGALASFPKAPLARELVGRPAAVVGFALVFGIAGAAFQLSRKDGPPTSPEDPAARSPGSPP